MLLILDISRCECWARRYQGRNTCSRSSKGASGLTNQSKLRVHVLGGHVVISLISSAIPHDFFDVNLPEAQPLDRILHMDVAILQSSL